MSCIICFNIECTCKWGNGCKASQNAINKLCLKRLKPPIKPPGKIVIIRTPMVDKKDSDG